MLSGDELIPRLTELYRLMDATYRSVAEEVQFSCEGCDGVKCCTVDLILHTHMEMLYLRRGLNTLDSALRAEILDRSENIIRAKDDDPYGEAYRNAVCALNVEGRCALYEYRPMICRLAGIRHFVLRPDNRSMESVGCRRFEEDVLTFAPLTRIDRTPFYRAMADIEIEAVKALGKRTAPHTIAEVLGGDA